MANSFSTESYWDHLRHKDYEAVRRMENDHRRLVARQSGEHLDRIIQAMPSPPQKTKQEPEHETNTSRKLLLLTKV